MSSLCWYYSFAYIVVVFFVVNNNFIIKRQEMWCDQIYTSSLRAIRDIYCVYIVYCWCIVYRLPPCIIYEIQINTCPTWRHTDTPWWHTRRYLLHGPGLGGNTQRRHRYGYIRFVVQMSYTQRRHRYGYIRFVIQMSYTQRRHRYGYIRFVIKYNIQFFETCQMCILFTLMNYRCLLSYDKNWFVVLIL